MTQIHMSEYNREKSPFGPPIIPEGLEVSTGNPMYDKVLVFIKKDDSEAGLDVHTDFGPLGREFFTFESFLRFLVPYADIREACTWLNEEGHIYSTIDDDHYKTT